MKVTIGVIAYRRADGSFLPARPIQREVSEEEGARIEAQKIDLLASFFAKRYEEHLRKKQREEEQQRQLRLERSMLSAGIRELEEEKK